MRIYQIDAFTAEPFRGNPAGVVLLTAPAEPAWMQAVAAEMNLAETAFVLRRPDGFGLRWFTPAVEVALCGHATLASAHALWEAGWLTAHEPARFHTLSGLLVAERRGDEIELDFPATPPRPADAPAALRAALGVDFQYVGKSIYDYLLRVDSEATVRALRPDFARLKQVETRGVIVTSRSATSDADFVSRFFGPAVGIDEDPVTGSAHCCLASYWAEELGRPELRGYQASARGGYVRVRLAGDRVRLGGSAVTVFRGELLA